MDPQEREAKRAEAAAKAERDALRAEAIAQARELLAPTDLTAMETFVSQLHSSDDSERSAATKLFEFCAEEYANSQCLKLAHLFQFSRQFDTRTRAGSLFYALLLHPWYSLKRIFPMILPFIKSAFIDCLRQEMPETHMRIACLIVHRIAQHTFQEHQDWPELVEYVTDCVAFETHYLQTLACLVFDKIPESINRLLGKWLEGLASSDSGTQRFSVTASANLICIVPNTLYRKLEDLLPEILRVLFGFYNGGQEVYVQEVLGELQRMAMAAVGYFAPRLNRFFVLIIEIAENEALTEQTRIVAVKVLNALNDGVEPELIQKLPSDTVRNLFSVLMRRLAVIQDDPAWYDAGDEDGVSAGQSESYDIGLYFLDQLSVYLGGDILVKIALKVVPEYLKAPEWEKRFAGITALSATAEGNSEMTAENLDQVVNMALILFEDPHARVRWAAINALLTLEFGSKLQVHYQLILPALAAAIGDFRCIRTQAHAAVATSSLCKDCSPSILTPHLAEIVSKLHVLLQRGNQLLQEEALVTLASVASSSQDQFQMHCDKLIPVLKAIMLKNAADTSKSTLFAKSTECICSIMMAVGKEKVMEFLVSLEGSLVEGDNYMQMNILQSLSRFCKCLGSDFHPYTGVMMRALLRIVQLGSDINKITAESGGVSDKFHQSSGSLNEEEINILKKTALSCVVLRCFAAELKEKFCPWIDQVTDIMSPLVNFHHTETRLAAVSAMSALLQSAKLAIMKKQAEGCGNSYLQKLATNVVPALVEALSEECEKDAWSEVLNSLTGCIELSGSLFTKDQVTIVVNAIERVLTPEAADSFDLGKEKVGDCLCMLIKKFCMSDNHKTAEQKQTALCIFHDVVRKSPKAALKYCDFNLPFLLQACKDEHPIVQKEAARGIGICAEFGGAKFDSSAEEAVSSLKAMIGDPEAINSNNAIVYEIAVSALGKICEFRHNRINAAQVFSVWLSYLPIRNDSVDAKLVHEQLCSMLEKSGKELLGPDNINLPQIMEVFYKVMSEWRKSVTLDTVGRIIELLETYKNL